MQCCLCDGQTRVRQGRASLKLWLGWLQVRKKAAKRGVEIQFFSKRDHLHASLQAYQVLLKAVLLATAGSQCMTAGSSCISMYECTNE